MPETWPEIKQAFCHAESYGRYICCTPLEFLVITPDIISYYVEDDPTLLIIFSL